MYVLYPYIRHSEKCAIRTRSHGRANPTETKHDTVDKEGFDADKHGLRGVSSRWECMIQVSHFTQQAMHRTVRSAYDAIRILSQRTAVFMEKGWKGGPEFGSPCFPVTDIFPISFVPMFPPNLVLFARFFTVSSFPIPVDPLSLLTP